MTVIVLRKAEIIYIGRTVLLDDKSINKIVQLRYKNNIVSTCIDIIDYVVYNIYGTWQYHNYSAELLLHNWSSHTRALSFHCPTVSCVTDSSLHYCCPKFPCCELDMKWQTPYCRTIQHCLHRCQKEAWTERDQKERHRWWNVRIHTEQWCLWSSPNHHCYDEQICLLFDPC